MGADDAVVAMVAGESTDAHCMVSVPFVLSNLGAMRVKITVSKASTACIAPIAKASMATHVEIIVRPHHRALRHGLGIADARLPPRRSCPGTGDVLRPKVDAMNATAMDEEERRRPRHNHGRYGRHAWLGLAKGRAGTLAA